MPHRWKHFILLSSVIGFFGPGCAVRNAEYDQLIADGDYVQAKNLIRRLLDEFSFRDENPTMPARRAQLYYWLANAHGKLAEYDSLKLALSLSVSNDPGFTDARQELLYEFSLSEYNKAVARYNETVYQEAIAGWKNALDLTESEPSGVAFSALVNRNLGFAEAGQNSIDRAVHYLTRAGQLGDDRAQEILEDFQGNKTITPPDRLRPLETFITSQTSSQSGPPGEIPQPAAPEEIPQAESEPLTEGAEFAPIKHRTSWTVQDLAWQDISRLPMRGPENYLPLLNGVVDVNKGFHVRGSRTGETGYLLDDIAVLNPFYNTNGVPLIPEAIEELELHSSAYGSTLGSKRKS